MNFRVAFCGLLFFFHSSLKAQQISLAGKWRFAVDSSDRGISEGWATKRLAVEIQLPGSMAQNGKGDEVTLRTKWTGSIYDSSFFFRPSLAKYRQPGNLKIPFWLTPAKHYVGPAWYQKEVFIPAGWKGKEIELFLERVHFQTTVWVDGKRAGGGNSLSTPHRFHLSSLLQPGKHLLTIRVDNRIKDANVGPDSHSVSDHTQGNWNGLVGKLLLRALPAALIEEVQVYPDIRAKRAKVLFTLINTGVKTVRGNLTAAAKSCNTATAHTVAPVTRSVTLKGGDTLQVDLLLPMGEKMQLWDEFSPALYELAASWSTPGHRQEKKLSFGMREIKVDGTKLLVNGRPVFLRGTLHNGEAPLTGYPAMDEAGWSRIFQTARAHGLNHVRFHSWCPPEAAFAAADKAGIYLQPEAPTWPNHGTSVGDGRFIDRYIYEETDRMVAAYGSHPSFCMLAAGNEPAGRNQAAYLAGFVRYWKAKDSRRVYTGASVAMSWPLVPENEYMIKSGPRGLSWAKSRPESVTDYRAAIEKFTVPYVTHEMGQWCVFPDFKEIQKYTGVYHARNFELFRELLNDHGMDGQAEDFLWASGKLQALCYKHEIEKSLRTPGLAGFQLLGLQDFPGQGSAMIGVLNAFWQEKGYVSAGEWRRFCNATVPLLRTGTFVYTNRDTLAADVELYHYGKEALERGVVQWTLAGKDGKRVAGGRFSPKTYPAGGNLAVGKISLPLHAITEATQLRLTVSVEGSPFQNDWNFWVYPAQLPQAATMEVYVTDTLDARAEEVLGKGGKVFLNAAGKVVKGKEIVMHFTPVFWNTSWFKMQPPHVTGMLIKKEHPMLAQFPTESHTDLQWWAIANRAQVMHLEDFPKGFQPIVQPIDTWFMNRRLALILEAKVGNGKLVVSSANLGEEATDPAARQLWYSIRRYMASSSFDPAQPVDLAVIKDLLKTPSRETWDSFTKDSPDELKPNLHQTNNK
ncbi:sugar-binding domain-containing protein [Paraflavisolibacter sp. H34]|uniref:exo-beta-1,4-galactosidase n=1 Tax=Huijunlia imazamoxiresistens TaxID=3127457 RepID=UPI00301AE37E